MSRKNFQTNSHQKKIFPAGKKMFTFNKVATENTSSSSTNSFLSIFFLNPLITVASPANLNIPTFLKASCFINDLLINASTVGTVTCSSSVWSRTLGSIPKTDCPHFIRTIKFNNFSS